MDGEIDYSRMSRPNLEESLRNIDRNAYPINFARLQEALARDPSADPPPPANFAPSVEFEVRFSLPDGPLHALSPTRNSLGLAGTGRVVVGVTDVTLLGRRVGLLPPLGIPRTIFLHRDSITNVEFDDNVVLFHGRSAKGGLLGIRVWTNDAADAVRLADLLGTKSETAIPPQLHRLADAEKSLYSRSPLTPVTLVLLFTNVITFVISAILQSDPHGPYSSYTAQGANLGIFTSNGEWWRLLSYSFLHLGPLHLLFNMWALAAVGPVTERMFGSVLFGLLYILCGVVAGLASMASHPDVVSVGASGAIFGLFGALLGALLLRRVDYPAVLWRPLLGYAALFISVSLISGISNTMVDNAAHWGGLLTGIMLSFVLDERTSKQPKPLSPAVRLTVTAMLSLCVIMAGGWVGLLRAQSVHGEAAYARNLHWMVRREPDINSLYTRDVTRAKANQMSDAEFVEVLNGTIVPFWREAALRWSNVQLPASSSKTASLQFLKHVSADRAAAYKHLATAVAAGDTAAATTAFAELHRVELALADFAKAHRSP